MPGVRLSFVTHLLTEARLILKVPLGLIIKEGEAIWNQVQEQFKFYQVKQVHVDLVVGGCLDEGEYICSHYVLCFEGFPMGWRLDSQTEVGLSLKF